MVVGRTHRVGDSGRRVGYGFPNRPAEAVLARAAWTSGCAGFQKSNRTDSATRRGSLARVGNPKKGDVRTPLKLW
jgi:hypothetical protein